MKTCLFCNEVKSTEELSAEHLIPRALGGNIVGGDTNPFKIDNVCIRCNNLCGLYIDAPFIKSWSVSLDHASLIQKYANISENPSLPLRFIGHLTEFKWRDFECDYWMGPTGDRIYHFHLPYPKEGGNSTIVGWDPKWRGKKIDPGFAFMFIRATNPEWHQCIVNSYKNQFRGADLYFGNLYNADGQLTVPIPSELEGCLERLRGMNKKVHNGTTVWDLGMGDRFHAKLALGFGYIHLGDQFAKSQSADLLRKFMQTKNFEERMKIPVQRSGFILSENGEFLNQLFSSGDNHLIAIINLGKSLALILNFFGSRISIIQITDETKLFESHIPLRKGYVYAINPVFQRSVGPVSLGKYFGHFNAVTNGESSNATELIQFETWAKNIPSPPKIFI